MTTGSHDEDLIRAFLEMRVPFWETLPYDWMEMGDADIDDLNLLDIPAEVQEAYRRSRANPVHHERYAKDYDRFDRSKAWAKKIIAEAPRSN